MTDGERLWEIDGVSMRRGKVRIRVRAESWDHAREIAAKRGIDWDRIVLIG